MNRQGDRQGAPQGASSSEEEVAQNGSGVGSEDPLAKLFSDALEEGEQLQQSLREILIFAQSFLRLFFSELKHAGVAIPALLFNVLLLGPLLLLTWLFFVALVCWGAYGVFHTVWSALSAGLLLHLVLVGLCVTRIQLLEGRFRLKYSRATLAAMKEALR